MYKVWLAFRLADEYAAFLKSGAGREVKKEEAAEAISTYWLPDELAKPFIYRLVGDEDGWGELRAVWITALNKLSLIHI